MGQLRGLNHVTLAVSRLDDSLRFYRDLLGLDLRAVWREGAYLEAGSLWLCLSVDAAAHHGPHPDYTHLAFDVGADDFAALSARLSAAAPVWRENKSEGESLYILDPDGHKLELHVGSLKSRLDHYRANPRPDLTVIDE